MLINAGDTNPCVRSVFCLRHCSEIVGCDVLCFEREADMLAAWRDFIIEVRSYLVWIVFDVLTDGP